MSDKDAPAADESQSPTDSSPSPNPPESGGESSAAPAKSETPPAGERAKPGAPPNRSAAAAKTAEPTLGADFSAARERRGRSREDVARETRIPAHYVRMIESDDYSMIADQLYMLPFVRRYAAYLAIDQDEAAMRFVREVQRADSNPAPRLDHPLDVVAPKRSRRSGAIVVIAIVVILAGLYFYVSPRQRQAADSVNPALAGGTPVSPQASSAQPPPPGYASPPAAGSPNAQ